MNSLDSNNIKHNHSEDSLGIANGMNQKSSVRQLKHGKNVDWVDIVRFTDCFGKHGIARKSSQDGGDTIWIGLERDGMHIGVELAAELAALLYRFAETGEIVEMVTSDCSEKGGDHIADAGKKAAFKSIDGLVADYNSDPVRKAMIDWARAEIKDKVNEHDHHRDATKLIEQPPMSRERLRQEAALKMLNDFYGVSDHSEIWREAEKFVKAGYPE